MPLGAVQKFTVYSDVILFRVGLAAQFGDNFPVY